MLVEPGTARSYFRLNRNRNPFRARCNGTAVEHEAGTSYSVEFPDLPGCFSAAATPLEIAPRAGEAVEAWIAVALERGQAVPQPSALDHLRGRKDLAGRGLMFN